MSDLEKMKSLGYACFCGGYGTYTDYNCEASYEVECPHCWGSGIKKCDCEKVSLRCEGKKRVLPGAT